MNDGFCGYVLWGFAGHPSAELCPEPAADDSEYCEAHSEVDM